MSQATRSSYGNRGGSSRGAASQAKVASGDFDSSTTHYAKDSSKEFVNNVQIWENSGEYGAYLKIRVSETLAPGDYFVSARKGHLSKIVNS